MKIRNKKTGKTFEVMEGTLYPTQFYEKVTDERIKIGEPKIEFEIEQTQAEAEAELKKKEKKVEKPAKKSRKKKNNQKGKKNYKTE